MLFDDVLDDRTNPKRCRAFVVRKVQRTRSIVQRPFPRFSFVVFEGKRHEDETTQQPTSLQKGRHGQREMNNPISCPPRHSFGEQKPKRERD